MEEKEDKRESWLMPSIVFSPEATKIWRETSYSTEVKTLTSLGIPSRVPVETGWLSTAERGGVLQGDGGQTGSRPQCLRPLVWASVEAPTAVPSQELPKE